MKKIQKSIRISFIVLLVLFLQAGIVSAIEITIDVAPNVLNIQNKGQVVTIHTDIAYNIVLGSTVTLNGIEISSWKSDDRGNFVAKFLIEEIKALPLVIGGMNTLVLTGTTINGDNFTGRQDIKVIDTLKAKK